ncbi:MAG: hypothetical protein LIV24_11320 [Eubacterium sp.]|nr:hypothetical protein [Eubacterium sp.]
MDNSKKAVGCNWSFWFTALAQGMVLIDVFCSTPLKNLTRSNPTAILPFLLVLHAVLPGTLTGVFLFMAVRHEREATTIWKVMSGILAIAVNVVILAVSLYNIYGGHPLIFVMIGYGIVMLVCAGRQRREF